MKNVSIVFFCFQTGFGKCIIRVLQVTEPKGYMREDLLGELAHMIVEVKKSHNRPSASWRTRKAGGWLSPCPEASESGKLTVHAPV